MVIDATILAGTGHRLKDLGGHHNTIRWRLYCLCYDALQYYKPVRVISGCANGFDLALATAAVDCDISLTAALPCWDQEKVWSDPYDLTLYYRILKMADKVIYITVGPYDNRCMSKRNRWMTDNSTHTITLYNGKSRGGTASNIAYSRQKGKEPLNLWPLWQSKYSKYR